MLTITFPELPPDWDLMIDLWSIDLAQGGTRSGDNYRWKQHFFDNPRKKKKRIQVLRDKKWFDATIIKTYEKVEKDT